MSNKKILLISPFATSLLFGGYKPGPGGAERQMTLIANLLSGLNTEIYFCCSHKENKNPQNNKKIKIFYNSFRYLGNSKVFFFIDGFKLLIDIIKIKPHYIIIRSGGPLLLFWLLIARKFIDTKIILSIQNDRDIDPLLLKKGERMYMAMLYQKLIKKMDIILCQHKNQEKIVKKSYCQNTILIPSIVDNLWEEDNFSPNKNTILWVGNSTPNKRYEIVLELAKLLPEYEFAVAMNNSDKKFNFYKNYSEKLTNIRFLGSVSPRTSETLFANAKLVLNTSIYEGFPNVLLQSWKSGVPVVTAGIDPGNIIKKLELGKVMFIDHLSENSLRLFAQEIKNILTDSDLWNKMSKNAKEYIATNHSIERITDLYKSTLNI